MRRNLSAYASTFAALAIAGVAGLAAAQSGPSGAQSAIAIFPSYLNFCGGADDSDATRRRPILGGDYGREMRVISVHNTGKRPLTVEKSTLIQRVDRARETSIPGIVPPLANAAQPANFVARESRPRNPLAPPSGFEAFTNCADDLGNPLTLAPGQSCSVLVQKEAAPYGREASIAVRTNDPTNPIVTVPIIVSDVSCGTSSAFARVGGVVAPGRFVPIPREEVVAEPATIYNHYSCSIACRTADGGLGAIKTVHVACWSTDVNCCDTYVDFACGGAGSVFGSRFLFSQ